ncbi:lysylphosphatidylglycerol synthase domain-containing protein [Bradyrhizobium sp. CCBAU 45384]|uniref:lysylphosphatidylglycerol synthase domain-containing protein n=1 Tax=Bradyrhizobium sp. CCBAU 45384 TaxID=858428 RepID=UPI0023065C05|nr:lysylphosphatidylglycerol synthase domain-containing protein [Bradyrhizobium sp. CCBAU 45384]MDA9408564.1 hypothetical protein [Bradyrhizobium sp. CCBAU 45384]
MRPSFFVAAEMLMLLSIAVATLRYQSMLQTLCSDGPVHYFPLLKLNLLTLFSSHFVPFGALADAMRALVSRKLLKMPVGKAVEGVIADRALAVAGFALFGLLLLPLQISMHWPWRIVMAQVATFGGLFVLLGVAAFGLTLHVRFLKSAAEAARRFLGHIATCRSLGWWLGLDLLMALRSKPTMLYISSAGRPRRPAAPACSQRCCCCSGSACAFRSGARSRRRRPSIFRRLFISSMLDCSREIAFAASLVPSDVLVDSDAVALSLSIGLCNLAASVPGVIFAGPLLQALRGKTIAPGMK